MVREVKHTHLSIRTRCTKLDGVNSEVHWGPFQFPGGRKNTHQSLTPFRCPCPPSLFFGVCGKRQEGVPYITSEPAVTALDLTSADHFLVLATDGVWEQLSNEDAVRCVSSALKPLGEVGASVGGGKTGTSPGTMRRQQRNAAGGGGSGSGGGATSDALVNSVLARSAQGHGMSVPALRALPRGPRRRMLHDDVCATVVHFTDRGR